MNSDTHTDIDLQKLAITLLRYLGRYYKFLLLSTTVGIALGIVLWVAIPPSFESEMMVSSDILTESYSKRISQSLNRLVKEKNDSILALRLNLTRGEALQVGFIEIEGLKKEADLGALERSNSRIYRMEKPDAIFVIKVSVGDKTILPKLQKGLVDFLRSNEFVTARVEQRERKYRALIEKIDQEIKTLDSLKQRLFHGKHVYKSSTEMVPIDPTSIPTKIIELNELQIEYMQSLELFNSIHLIEGFTPFMKPSSPKLSIALLIGFTLGLLAAIGILTLKELIAMAFSNRGTSGSKIS